MGDYFAAGMAVGFIPKTPGLEKTSLSGLNPIGPALGKVGRRRNPRS
jgi:hypothetical protein